MTSMNTGTSIDDAANANSGHWKPVHLFESPSFVFEDEARFVWMFFDDASEDHGYSQVFGLDLVDPALALDETRDHPVYDSNIPFTSVNLGTHQINPSWWDCKGLESVSSFFMHNWRTFLEDRSRGFSLWGHPYFSLSRLALPRSSERSSKSG